MPNIWFFIFSGCWFVYMVLKFFLRFFFLEFRLKVIPEFVVSLYCYENLACFYKIASNWLMYWLMRQAFVENMNRFFCSHRHWEQSRVSRKARLKWLKEHSYTIFFFLRVSFPFSFSTFNHIYCYGWRSHLDLASPPTVFCAMLTMWMFPNSTC